MVPNFFGGKPSDRAIGGPGSPGSSLHYALELCDDSENAWHSTWRFFVAGGTPQVPRTNIIAPENGLTSPKGKDRIPTIHFQVRKC